jgi:hypothetical protein
MSNNGGCSLMTGPSLPLRDGFLLSPRTASYIDAKQSPVACAPRGLVAAEIGTQTNTSGYRNPSPNFALAISYAPIPRVLWQVHQASSKVPEIRIRHRLEKVRNAWDDFQANRARDAVYGYLEAVFAIVSHYKTRRKTNKLFRHAFKFANLPFDKRADPFTAVIRCTTDENADNKTISKWARALRYVARYKVPPTQLRMSMKQAGGVNACADRYARCFGRRGR